METRNGQTTAIAYRIRSYRTYEEWKPKFVIPSAAAIVGSYRTYEEWKQVTDVDKLRKNIGSYRTYEEWKPCCRTYRRHCVEVLTVPMRNGNMSNNLPTKKISKFLPYL